MRLTPLLVVAALLLAAPPARAQTDADKSAARRVAAEGYRLLMAEDYRAAIRKFRGAEELVHAPTHLFYIASAHEALGELLAARDLYRTISLEEPRADEPAAFRQARLDARASLEQLEPRIPRLTVVIEGRSTSEVEITVDDEPRSGAGAVELDPGKHQVEGRTEGHAPVRASVELDEGARSEVALRFGSDDSAPPPVVKPTRPWIAPAVAGFGVGVAGVALGAVAGALSLGKVSDLDDRCPERRCFAEDETIADDARLMGTVSTVGFIVGGVGLAVGTVLVVWQPGGSTEPVALGVGPGALSLRGAF
jgi:hypothetical protein